MATAERLSGEGEISKRRERRETIWRQLGGIEKVWFVEEGYGNVAGLVRDLVTRVKTRKEQGKETVEVVDIRGLPGSGKTWLATRTAELLRLEGLTVTEESWEKQGGKVKGERRGGPDPQSTLWEIGAMQDAAVCQAIASGEADVVLVDRPGPEVMGKGRVIVGRPYAPFLTEIVKQRRLPVLEKLGTETTVAYNSVCLIPGPWMLPHVYIRSELQRRFAERDLAGAAKLCTLMGKEVPEDLFDLGRMQEGGKVETIEIAGIQTVPYLIDLTRRGLSRVPNFIRRYFKGYSDFEPQSERDVSEWKRMRMETEEVARFLEKVTEKKGIEVRMLGQMAIAGLWAERIWPTEEVDLIKEMTEMPPRERESRIIRLKSEESFLRPERDRGLVEASWLVSFGDYMRVFHSDGKARPGVTEQRGIVAMNDPVILPQTRQRIKEAGLHIPASF